MRRLYLEEHSDELLQHKRMSKSEFATRLGIKRQNVNSVFKTTNINTIKKIACILDVPVNLLISTPEEGIVNLTGQVSLNGEIVSINNVEDVKALLGRINNLH